MFVWARTVSVRSKRLHPLHSIHPLGRWVCVTWKSLAALRLLIKLLSLSLSLVQFFNWNSPPRGIADYSGEDRSSNFADRSAVVRPRSVCAGKKEVLLPSRRICRKKFSRVCVCKKLGGNFLPTFVTDFSTSIFLKFLLNFKYPELGERERKRERNDFIYVICTYRESMEIMLKIV